MADKKPGPVKPPIIDAKAREAGSVDEGEPRAEGASGATETKAGEKASASRPASGGGPETSRTSGTAAPKAGSEKSKTETAQAQKPKADSARSRSGGKPSTNALGAGALAATGLGGAALGFALAYGLAVFGFWPTPEPDTGATAAIESRIADLESALSGVTNDSGQADTRIGDLDTRLQSLETDVTGLAQSAPVAQSDLEALSARVDELANAVNAVSAGASGPDATQIGSDIASLQSRIDAVEGDLGNLVPSATGMTADLQGLEARVAELESAFADQPEVAEITAERDRFAQIPGIIATLERTIAAGDPFAASLADLEAVLPNLQIPQTVRAASATGISSTEAIDAELRALMPELLAARPHDPDAGIFETLMSQAQSAIALRPAGDVAGNSPDALLARAEAALENGDLAAARAALTALPDPMREVAAPVVEKTTAALSARDLLEAARDATNGIGEAAQ
ncbi:COG4223 family protein [Pelagibacterium xiamenense]|uniref:COG4223 family protein n=1 Tax=Pelagibacterium xiamenense TaxID=2901140 RepID=UPI001E637864|nr:hypothetical protein [Pelagibacterium xiamenense]MCD7058315.1 hypothetical protein [Pelagibacterium xiamenense]